jgi:hypothetical protein
MSGLWWKARRTYREVLECLAYDLRPTLKLRTKERYRTSFRQLNAVFGNRHLDEITPRWLTDLATVPSK